MMRLRRIVVAMVVAIACTRVACAADIVKVVISGKACAACADGVIVVERNGAISTTGGVSGPAVTDLQRAGDIIAGVPLAELRFASRTNVAVANALGVGVWISYGDGSHDYAVINVGQGGLTGSGALYRWLESAAFQATQSMMATRRDAIQAALISGSLGSVGLDMLGCYGTCPRYKVVFEHTGNASLRSTMPACEGDAKAYVPFALVVEALRSANVASLWASYPRRAVDTLGARITLDTPAGQFVSEGPDRTTWDIAFSSAQSRLDQIVRMTVWSPKIDVTACSRAGQRPLSSPSPARTP